MPPFPVADSVHDPMVSETKIIMSQLSTSKFLRFLSVWIGFVAFMAFGNTLQCFFDHSFLTTRLYTIKPDKNVTGLAARLFGIWTLLAAALRFACAVNIYNKTIYHLTFISFFLALGHFLSEVMLYHTAEFSVGICAPLIVSSVSIVLMAVGYLIPEEPVMEDRDDTVAMSMMRKSKFS